MDAQAKDRAGYGVKPWYPDTRKLPREIVDEEKEAAILKPEAGLEELEAKVGCSDRFDGLKRSS